MEIDQCEDVVLSEFPTNGDEENCENEGRIEFVQLNFYENQSSISSKSQSQIAGIPQAIDTYQDIQETKRSEDFDNQQIIENPVSSKNGDRREKHVPSPIKTESEVENVSKGVQHTGFLEEQVDNIENRNAELELLVRRMRSDERMKKILMEENYLNVSEKYRKEKLDDVKKIEAYEKQLGRSLFKKKEAGQKKKVMKKVNLPTDEKKVVLERKMSELREKNIRLQTENFDWSIKFSNLKKKVSEMEGKNAELESLFNKALEGGSPSILREEDEVKMELEKTAKKKKRKKERKKETEIGLLRKRVSKLMKENMDMMRERQKNEREKEKRIKGARERWNTMTTELSRLQYVEEQVVQLEYEKIHLLTELEAKNQELERIRKIARLQAEVPFIENVWEKKKGEKAIDVKVVEERILGKDENEAVEARKSEEKEVEALDVKEVEEMILGKEKNEKGQGKRRRKKQKEKAVEMKAEERVVEKEEEQAGKNEKEAEKSPEGENETKGEEESGKEKKKKKKKKWGDYSSDFDGDDSMDEAFIDFFSSEEFLDEAEKRRTQSDSHRDTKQQPTRQKSSPASGSTQKNPDLRFNNVRILRREKGKRKKRKAKKDRR